MPHLTVCNRQLSWTLILVLGYVFYLLLGATVFQLLEKQAESKTRDQFQLEKLKFLQNYTCLDRQALEQFVQIIMEAWEKGVNPEGNSTNPSNWDFSNSFFFAGTVVTTIGYGNLAPSTVPGQVFCVFYALFGVPLNLAFLSQLGKGLSAHLINLERWFHKPGRAQIIQALAMALFLLAGTLLFLVFPPMIFSYVEGWSYGEGFYFTFITLSTIGFGDYVVGNGKKWWRLILTLESMVSVLITTRSTETFENYQRVINAWLCVFSPLTLPMCQFHTKLFIHSAIHSIIICAMCKGSIVSRKRHQSEIRAFLKYI